jgi:ataxia telangiectasia mutated family protein
MFVVVRVASRCARADTRAVQLHKVSYQAGRFHDRMFQTLWAKQRSPEFEHKSKLHGHNRRKIDSLQRTYAQQVREQIALNAAHGNAPIIAGSKEERAIKIAEQNRKELQFFLVGLEKEYKMDEDELKHFETNLYSSLEKAVEQYTECLRSGDQYNSVVVYRLVSLWFTHYAHRPISDVQRRIYASMKQIPSFKWLPLVYQIASRLGSSSNPAASPPEQQLFRGTVQELIVQMASDHPYHTLYQIFALRHGDKLHAASK